MNWQTVNPSASRTECGRYSVCRVTYVNEHGPYPVWEAWKGKEMIGKRACQDEARQLCEDDRRDR